MEGKDRLSRAIQWLTGVEVPSVEEMLFGRPLEEDSIFGSESDMDFTDEELAMLDPQTKGRSHRG
jgi:hypothetical protein